MNIDIEKLKNTLLADLSDTEKELAFSMLNDISNTGASKQYNDLLYADFTEIPVDIDTFLDDDNYMGKAWKDKNGKSKLFPAWRETLHELFPDNIRTDVNTLLESGARGIGKSENACGAVAAYLMYRVMCLKDPTEYYGLKVTEKIVFAFMNITKALAEKIAIDKFQKSIQLSPWFMSRGKMTSYNNNPYWLPPEPIEIVIGSQSSDVIGQPIFFAFFDEISFIKNMDVEKQKAKAIDMIDTALGGMKTRFIKAGGKDPTVLVVASSKRSEQSFMETYIKDKFESEPDNIIVVDRPVWEVQPRENFSKETFNVAVGNKYLVSKILTDDESVDPYLAKGYKILEVPCTFKAKFKEDIDRSLCDYAGISSSELSKYISGAIVQENINTARFNPFIKDILEIGDAPDDKQQYYHFFDITRIPQELKRMPMCIHLDMSTRYDMTGIAGTWISGRKALDDGIPGNDLFFTLAFSVSIKAPKGRQISFEKNRNFIRWLREQGFNIVKVTADQFQSSDLLQILAAEGFNTAKLSCDVVNADHICLPYQSFRNALYEHRFDLYGDSQRLIDEITDLERNGTNGKIDHPPNGHKDASDAVCGSMYDCIEFADLYSFDYGGHYALVKDINMDGDTVSITELNKAFEEALLEDTGSGRLLSDSDYLNVGLIPPDKDDTESSWLMVM